MDYAPTESVAEWAVLIVLAEHANAAGGNAWPSVPTICQRSRLSESTVRRSIKRLRTAETISVVDIRPNGTFVYALSMVKPSAPVTVTPVRVTPLSERLPTPVTVTPKPSTKPPKVVRAKALTPAAPPKTPRARDPIWDALVEAQGKGQPVTKSERGRLNAACKQLRDADIDATAIARAAAAYRAEWPTVELTATALVANWTRFTANGHTETGIERLRRSMAERGVT